MKLLVEKVIVSPNDLEVRLRANGIERLVLELRPGAGRATSGGDGMSDIRIQKTGEPDIVEASDGRLTLSVPIQIKRRSGRKLVTLPNGETAPVRPWDVAPTFIQLALARATAGWRCWNRGCEVLEGDRHAGRNRQQLRQPDGQPDHAGTGYRPPSSTTRCRITSRCLIWRLIRRRCGMSSGSVPA